jgi:undecaprenyl-diphosphatase
MTPSNKRLLISSILVLLFATLAYFVTLHPINKFDVSISKFVQQFNTPVLDKVMIVISAFGNVEIALASLIITAGIFLVNKLKREAIFVSCITFTGIITFVLKRMFGRPRPTADVVTLIDRYQNNSFPSGHTLSYIVFFGFLIFLMKKLKSVPKYWRITVISIAHFMCVFGPISRIYLGAHWLTDIIGGLLIGLLYLQQLIWYYKRP